MGEGGLYCASKEDKVVGLRGVYEGKVAFSVRRAGFAISLSLISGRFCSI